MPAEVEKVIVSVVGPCFVPTTWKYLGTCWTHAGRVQTFLKPMPSLPAELVPAEAKDKA